MRHCLLFLILLVSVEIQAQDAKLLIAQSCKRFDRVQTYVSDGFIRFDIPSINIREMKAKIYYKAPEKFRVKVSGVAFLPKQNPYYLMKALRDTGKYIAVLNGTEKVRGETCQIINVIPHSDPDLLMAKIWVANNSSIYKSQVTSKSNGTIDIEYYYGAQMAYSLPDRMVFTVDMTKFKLPKAISVDINSKSKEQSKGPVRSTGTIQLDFSNYKINSGLPDSVFVK